MAKQLHLKQSREGSLASIWTVSVQPYGFTYSIWRSSGSWRGHSMQLNERKIIPRYTDCAVANDWSLVIDEFVHLMMILLCAKFYATY